MAGSCTSSDPGLAQSPSQTWVIPWQFHLYYEAATPPSATQLLQTSPGLFLTEAKVVVEGYGLEPAANLSV